MFALCKPNKQIPAIESLERYLFKRFMSSEFKLRLPYLDSLMHMLTFVKALLLLCATCETADRQLDAIALKTTGSSLHASLRSHEATVHSLASKA
jgi:hypothetical protein